MRGVVQFIARKHGPGRLWSHGGVPIGPLQRRDQDGYRGMQVGGVLHVVMGCYYYHKPDECRPYAPGAGMSNFGEALRKARTGEDVEYDGVSLRFLLAADESARRHEGHVFVFTPYQRAVISAHWSAELRCRVAEREWHDAQRERNQVLMPVDAEDIPW